MGECGAEARDARLSGRWWEEEGLDLVGVQEAEAAVDIEEEPNVAAGVVGGG